MVRVHVVPFKSSVFVHTVYCILHIVYCILYIVPLGIRFGLHLLSLSEIRNDKIEQQAETLPYIVRAYVARHKATVVCAKIASTRERYMINSILFHILSI